MTERTAGGYDKHLICEHPWSYNVVDVDGEGLGYGADVEIFDGYDTPHTIIEGCSGLSYDCTLANVRLMAHSPELLEACRMAESVLASSDIPCGDVLAVLRKVISKATGA